MSNRSLGSKSAMRLTRFLASSTHDFGSSDNSILSISHFSPVESRRTAPSRGYLVQLYRDSNESSTRVDINIMCNKLFMQKVTQFPSEKQPSPTSNHSFSSQYIEATHIGTVAQLRGQFSQNESDRFD